MQTKSSYSVLKWAFLAGLSACLASACVVSSGDGNDDDTDITEGGDGGTNNNTAGKSTGGGGSSSAGTNSSSGAPTTDGGEPATGTGGMPSTFVPGECQVDVDPITPTEEANCDAADGDSACIACVKLQACSEYGTCFGTGPATACSVGQTEGAEGQFVCVSECFKAGAAAAIDADMLLGECAAQCDECGSGGLNDETTDLIAAANDPGTCQDECFPFE
jgi:hypothetical protein